MLRCEGDAVDGALVANEDGVDIVVSDLKRNDVYYYTALQ